MIQSIISFVLVLLAERLTSLLLYCTTFRGSAVSLDADQECLLREDGKLQPHRTEALRRPSPLRRTAVHQRLRHVFWRIIPVAIVYFAKLVLGNVFLTYVLFLTKKIFTDTIRVQPVTSTCLHSNTGRSRSIVPCIERFPEWRLTFGSGNMLPDRSNFKRGPGHDAALRPESSGSVTGRFIDDS